MGFNVFYSLLLLVILQSGLLVLCVEDISVERTFPAFYDLDTECMYETNASDEDIELIQSFHLPSTKEGRCLLDCMFKKINIITPEGQYNHDGCISTVKKILDFYPEALEKAIAVIDLCSIKLAAIDVAESSCEIAATLFSCVIDEMYDQGYDFDSSEYLN